MIPTVDAARLALMPYLLWIKLAAVLLVVLAIFGAGWKVGAGLTETRWQSAQASQAREYQSALAHAREAERASYTRSQEVSRDYQSKLAALEGRYADAARSIGPVRVCVAAAAPAHVPAVSAPASRPHAADDRPDVPRAPAGDPGRDVGPELIALVRDADVCRERLPALQAWAAGQ